jgi:hypothetical protein
LDYKKYPNLEPKNDQVAHFLRKQKTQMLRNQLEDMPNYPHPTEENRSFLDDFAMKSKKELRKLATTKKHGQDSIARVSRL